MALTSTAATADATAATAAAAAAAKLRVELPPPGGLWLRCRHRSGHNVSKLLHLLGWELRHLVNTSNNKLKNLNSSKNVSTFGVTSVAVAK